MSVHDEADPGLSRRAVLVGGLALGGATALGVRGPAKAAAAAPAGRGVRRVTFDNGRGGTIVGNLQQVRADAVIVMAHGWQGNKSSKGRFDYLAEVFRRAGYATLSIDFAGCGESSDDVITMAGATEDLRSAVRYVRRLGYRRVGLFGNSWGSHICLRAFDGGVGAIVLTGALTAAMHYDWAEYYPADQLAELAQTGRMTVPDPEPIWRTTQVLSQQSLDDYAQIDQQSVLAAISAPTLIMHGNVGWEEQTLLAHDEEGIALLPEPSRMAVFHGASHDLAAYLHGAGALAAQWFDDNLAR